MTTNHKSVGTHPGPNHTEVLEILDLAFQYWTFMPQPTHHTDVDKLRADYQKQEHSHWFDSATLEFFGSHPGFMHMPAPGIIVEPQFNGPEGIGRYAVTVFVWDTDEEPARINPKLIGRFDDSAVAAQFARDAYEAMTA